MPRVKKSRKPGMIGIPKSNNTSDGYRKKGPVAQPTKVKKSKGKPAGSRHSVASSDKAVISGPKKDPRVGSTKKIELAPNKPKVVQPKVKRYATPAQELAALEADERLAMLLDKYDNDATLTKDDVQYLESKMARHKILCDLLGIKDEDEGETNEASNAPDLLSEDDPLKTFESININDFK